MGLSTLRRYHRGVPKAPQQGAVKETDTMRKVPTPDPVKFPAKVVPPPAKKH